MSSLTREYTETRTPRTGTLRNNNNPQPNNLDGLKLIGIAQSDGTPNPFITQYNLTGNGRNYGIIDGGMVLSTHQRAPYSRCDRLRTRNSTELWSSAVLKF